MPSSRDLANPGIKPRSPVAPTLQVDSLPLSHQGRSLSLSLSLYIYIYIYIYIYVYIMEYFSAIAKTEIMFAATGTDLEIIILSEVSQTKQNKYNMISLTCGI